MRQRLPACAAQPTVMSCQSGTSGIVQRRELVKESWGEHNVQVAGSIVAGGGDGRL
jgi:hypothetical protein